MLNDVKRDKKICNLTFNSLKMRIFVYQKEVRKSRKSLKIMNIK